MNGLGVDEGLLALGHGEEESSFQAVMELNVSRWFSSAFFVTDSLVNEIHCDTCVAARGTPESDLVWGRVWEANENKLDKEITSIARNWQYDSK